MQKKKSQNDYKNSYQVQHELEEVLDSLLKTQRVISKLSYAYTVSIVPIPDLPLAIWHVKSLVFSQRTSSHKPTT